MESAYETNRFSSTVLLELVSAEAVTPAARRVIARQHGEFKSAHGAADPQALPTASTKQIATRGDATAPATVDPSLSGLGVEEVLAMLFPPTPVFDEDNGEENRGGENVEQGEGVAADGGLLTSRKESRANSLGRRCGSIAAAAPRRSAVGPAKADDHDAKPTTSKRVSLFVQPKDQLLRSRSSDHCGSVGNSRGTLASADDGMRRSLTGSKSDPKTPTHFIVASTQNTDRIDVLHLHTHLRKRCAAEHARFGNGVCVNREQVFRDGFMELLRQVSVLCPERGLLLSEISAEMDNTQDTYDFLFESGSEYAVRKAVERDLSKGIFDDEIAKEGDVRRLQQRVHELQAKLSGLEQRFQEQRSSAEKLHSEEVAFLKRGNCQVVGEIKRLIVLEKVPPQPPAALRD